jgi:hypothetical protein
MIMNQYNSVWAPFRGLQTSRIYSSLVDTLVSNTVFPVACDSLPQILQMSACLAHIMSFIVPWREEVNSIQSAHRTLTRQTLECLTVQQCCLTCALCIALLSTATFDMLLCSYLLWCVPFRSLNIRSSNPGVFSETSCIRIFLIISAKTFHASLFILCLILKYETCFEFMFIWFYIHIILKAVIDWQWVYGMSNVMLLPVLPLEGCSFETNITQNESIFTRSWILFALLTESWQNFFCFPWR